MENNSTGNSVSEAPVTTEVDTQTTVDTNERQSTPKLSRKLKLKVEGSEIEEDLPFEIDENNQEQVEFLKRHLQMSKVSTKRMQEASSTKKQVESFLKALQKDPMSVLSNPKIMGNEKFQEIAEAFLAKKLQEQMLSPEERAQMEKDERLSKYEQKEKAEREEQEKAQSQQLEAHYAKQFETTIMTALQSSSLPKNPFTVKRMAELMQKNLQHGLDLEPNQLAQLVKEDYQAELKGLIGNSDPEAILAMFGDDIANKIRKHDLSKFQVKNPEPKPVQKQSEATKERMSQREYTEWLKNQFKS